MKHARKHKMMLLQNVCGTFLYQNGEIQKPDKFENHCGDGTLSLPKLSSYFFLINCRIFNKKHLNRTTFKNVNDL